MKTGFVYLLSNKNRTTLYIGVTSNLERRTLQHKSGCGSVFSSRYHLTDLMYLMYFEEIQGMQNAIDREKQLKNWHKAWKWNLIKAENPEFRDLAADWFTEEEIVACRRAHKDSETRMTERHHPERHPELVSGSLWDRHRLLVCEMLKGVQRDLPAIVGS